MQTSTGLGLWDVANGERRWFVPGSGFLEALAVDPQHGVLAAELESLGPKRSRPRLIWFDVESGRTLGHCSLDAWTHEQPRLGPTVVDGQRIWVLAGANARDASRQILELRRPEAHEKLVVVDSGPEPLPPAWLNYLAPALGDQRTARSGWLLLHSGQDGTTGPQSELQSVRDVFVTLATDKRPVRWARWIDLPVGSRASLRLQVGSPDGKPVNIVVQLGEEMIKEERLRPERGQAPERGQSQWRDVEVDLSPWAGRPTWLFILQQAPDAAPSHAAWGTMNVNVNEQ